MKKAVLWLLFLILPGFTGAEAQKIPGDFSLVPFAADLGSPSNTLPPQTDVLPDYAGDMPLEMEDAVLGYVDYFRGPGRSWLLQTLDRSKPYQSLIFQTLREKKAPGELFYLAAVESAFVNHAVSWAGAAGMWQFMSGSIDGVKMKITPWVDERLDFWKATEGAAEKLLVNYRVLGDWNLAMAAYNAGLGRLTYVQRKNPAQSFWTLVQKGILPRETSLYVPQFHALAYLGSRLGREGFPLAWESPEPWVRLPLPQSIDLRILAQEAGLSYSLIFSYNRELKFPITPPVPGYQLKLPASMAAKAQEVLNNPNLKLLRFFVYTVRVGDMLGPISQHYGVPMTMLLKHNPGLNPDLLRPGQVLFIPALKEVGAYQGPPPAPKPVNASSSGGKANYRVQKGDTLWNLAQKAGISAQDLALANGITLQTPLKLNQSLYIPSRKAP